MLLLFKSNAINLQKKPYYITLPILLKFKKLLFYRPLQSKSSFFINRHTAKIIKITHKMFQNQNYFRKLIL